MLAPVELNAKPFRKSACGMAIASFSLVCGMLAPLKFYVTLYRKEFPMGMPLNRITILSVIALGVRDEGVSFLANVTGLGRARHGWSASPGRVCFAGLAASWRPGDLLLAFGP